MKPVHQTKTGNEHRGDCYRACIASVLELPIDDVPDFMQLQEDTGCCMTMESDKWLRDKHGKRIISIEMYKDRGGERTDQCLCNRLFHFNRDDFVIISGESPRKNADGSTKYHCVVAVADCWGFDIAHDPYPEGGGIVGEPYGVKWIVDLPQPRASQ